MISPGIFSCIRAGANTGATWIRPEIISLKNLANMQKMSPQKYFPAFAQVRIHAPHVFAKKNNSPRFFPACIGFVPGGGNLGKKWGFRRFQKERLNVCKTALFAQENSAEEKGTLEAQEPNGARDDGTLDIFETPVTVTPQQEISKTLNSSNIP